MPFERRSSAGRDLMERSSMGQPTMADKFAPIAPARRPDGTGAADRLGVTCHAIQAWEKGQRAVRKGWDFKLAEALGCSVADLRQGESVARRKRWR
jgi:hypothetical protein